jgi:hypothetical protein
MLFLGNLSFPTSVGDFFNTYFAWFQSQPPVCVCVRVCACCVRVLCVCVCACACACACVTLTLMHTPQTLAARGRRVRTVSGTGVPYEDRLLGGDDDDMHAGGAHPGQPPSESNIQQLVSMGFPRSRAVQALTATGNNVDQATEWLLSS